jgi:outer membrane biosynthesis protein TonB
MTGQRKERRKLGWAILISLLLHLAVGYSLAAFGSVFTPPLPPEDTPSELTLVDLSATPPPSVPKNPAFVETEPAKESAEKPKEQTFESNANSIAASKLPANGDAPLPTQDAKERPFLNLDTHDYSLSTDGSKPQPQAQATVQPESKPEPPATPKPKSSEPPKPNSTPAPAATPEPEKFAMLTATPPPPINAPEEIEPSPPPETAPSTAPVVPRPKPENPASNFQSQKQETRVTGRITNRGPSSVNAIGTPLGRYQKAVSDAIGSRWYYYMNSKMDLVSIGTAHVEAEVDAQGHIQKLRVLSNNANEAFANICLQSFQEAHLPPIPPDLVATLPDGRMPVDIYFTTYANQ